MIATGFVVACSAGPDAGDDDTSGAPSSLGTTTSAPGSTDHPDPTVAADSSGGSTDDTGAPPDPPPEPVPGLFAEYFADYHDAVLARVEPGIDAVWGLDAPDASLGVDRFSVRYTGWITAPSTGTYTIATEADDGIRVRVGGKLVIDDWIPHYVTRNEATIDLVGGVATPIVVEYFEADIEASIRLLWSSAALPEAPIPTSALTTIATPTDLPGPKPPYRNPVVGFDCPDPGVTATDDPASPWAMVCTGGSFPIRTSRDLVRWADLGAAILPNGKPSWAANGGRNWAPELHRHDDGLIAYFTSVNGSNQLCIGAATAADLGGPWIESSGPLVEHGQGVIDATYVVDGVTPYLVYKIDGNSVGAATPILARPLTADGLGFAPGGEATQLLVNDPGTWEGGVVEAPWIIARDGQWLMFYSGNVYDHRYRTGVARAPAVLGPYEKHGAPILANNERWVGPGHGSVVVVQGIDYFVYHAWPNAGDGTHDGGAGRHVLVDRIDYVDGWPRIHDGTPSRTLQPWPGDPQGG